MPVHQYAFSYEEWASDAFLNEADRLLLQMARAATANAYAPYSQFEVAAVARMANGATVQGTNQENASYPVGICAERTLLGTISSLYPNTAIDTMAISYMNRTGTNEHPAAPCGLCRQSMLEFEARMNHPIRFILAGQSGKVLIINCVKDLLPFSFTSEDLKK